ncbi:hypothetical protein AAFF_G00336030 [Aldrovandia affinis]|uniref:Solute carrier organic anion transporter family member n=1 Tax=Aldrovandia affinis TaxID=143900 RepID=A0AAD7SLQ9_9TELE|nr:hypothetical protein AAFF_G00336030 [Aldrovandia affinis]
MTAKIPTQSLSFEMAKPPTRGRSPFNSIRSFVFCHGLLQLAQLLVSGYLKSSISTIEKRYGFTSQKSGLLACFNEVGNTVLIVFVSFFGSRVHRPRFIGGGALIASLAGILMALPHFLSERYELNRSVSSILFSVTVIGPAVAFMLGSVMLKFYVDIDKLSFDEIKLQSDDPRWVGAWWLGFLLAAVFLAVTSLPYFFFPKELPKEEAVESGIDPVSEKLKEETNRSDPFQHLSLSEFLKSFPSIVMRTLRNPIYLLVVLAQVNLSAMIAGMATFMAKFIERQFMQTASFSNMMIGGVNIPVAMLGIVSGGAILRRFALSVKASALMSTIVMFVCVILALPLLFLGCPTQSINGVHPLRSNYHSDCGRTCSCQEEDFNPVCGSNGVEYISPCHAGCKTFIHDSSGRNILNYTDCSCVNVNGSPSFALPGTCGSGCSHLLLPFMILSSLTGFVAAFSQTPSFMMILRTVKPEDKSFALGIQFMLFRVLAFLPGPVLYGSTIDTTCILWGRKCNKNTSCRYYNLNHFRQRFLGLQVFFEFGAFVCFLMVFLILRKMKGKQRARRLNQKGEDEGIGKDLTPAKPAQDSLLKTSEGEP